MRNRVALGSAPSVLRRLYRADLGLSMRLRATRSSPSMLLDGVFELSEQLLRRVLARGWSNRCRLFLQVVFRRSGGYVRVIVAHASKDLPPRQHRQTNWPRWVNAYPHFRLTVPVKAV